MVGSGLFLLLLSGGILSLQDPGLIHDIGGSPIVEIAAAVAGVALASTPLWLLPYLSALRKRHHETSVILNHQVRNRLQEILGEAEILELHLSSSEMSSSLPEDLKLEMLSSIRGIRNSSLALIDSLKGIAQSPQRGATEMDYSLAIKQYEAHQPKTPDHGGADPRAAHS